MTESRRIVVAQGTFDILHPGHVHYLEESAKLGDHLEVIVARRTNVDHKRPPILPAVQRRKMVAALAAVDHARLGHPSDIFVPIEDIDPDVITLGFDQHHDPSAIKSELDHRGIECEVERIGPYEDAHDGLFSTREIIEAILERYD